MYIPVPSPFPQLEVFIHETAKHYNLDLFQCPIDEPELPVETVSGPATPGPAATNGSIPGAKVRMRAKGGEGMKRALEHYKEKFPHIEAILIGTRRGDPHGGEFSLQALASLDMSLGALLAFCVTLRYQGLWRSCRPVLSPQPFGRLRTVPSDGCLPHSICEEVHMNLVDLPRYALRQNSPEDREVVMLQPRG